MISPSISAHYGITEADYYQKRTRPEIQGILSVAKITIDEAAFNAAWEKVQGIFSRFWKFAYNDILDENCEASLIAIKNELSNWYFLTLFLIDLYFYNKYLLFTNIDDFWGSG